MPQQDVEDDVYASNIPHAFDVSGDIATGAYESGSQARFHTSIDILCKMLLFREKGNDNIQLAP